MFQIFMYIGPFPVNQLATYLYYPVTVILYEGPHVLTNCVRVSCPIVPYYMQFCLLLLQGNADTEMKLIGLCNVHSMCFICCQLLQGFKIIDHNMKAICISISVLKILKIIWITNK